MANQHSQHLTLQAEFGKKFVQNLEVAPVRNYKTLQVKRRWNGIGMPLVGIITSGLLIAQPTKAEETFDNTGIQFDVDTIVEFQFLSSQGRYQSTFGVIDLATGQKTPLLAEVKPADNPAPTPRASNASQDFSGTPGNAVPQPLAEFNFKARTKYAFYLESSDSGKPATIIYSTNSRNLASRQLVQFEGGIANLANQGTTITWSPTKLVSTATNAQPGNFDSFIVRAGGHLGCPYQPNR